MPSVAAASSSGSISPISCARTSSVSSTSTSPSSSGSISSQTISRRLRRQRFEQLRDLGRMQRVASCARPMRTAPSSRAARSADKSGPAAPAASRIRAVGPSGSEVGVVGPTAALRRRPGDDPVGILDVAGLAVHAVGGIHLQAAAARAIVHHLVDAGRAEARAGIAVFGRAARGAQVGCRPRAGARAVLRRGWSARRTPRRAGRAAADVSRACHWRSGESYSSRRCRCADCRGSRASTGRLPPVAVSSAALARPHHSPR